MHWLQSQKELAYLAIKNGDASGLRRVMDGVKRQSHIRAYNNDFIPHLLAYAGSSAKNIEVFKVVLNDTKFFREKNALSALKALCKANKFEEIKLFFKSADEKLEQIEYRRLTTHDYLRVACQAGETAPVMDAVKRGASLTQIDTDGNSWAMIWACEAGQIELMDVLLHRKVPIRKVETLYEDVTFAVEPHELEPYLETFLNHGYPFTKKHMDAVGAYLGMGLFDQQRASVLERLHHKWQVRRDRSMTPLIEGKVNKKKLLQTDKYGNRVIDYYAAQNRLSEVLKPSDWQGRKQEFWDVVNTLPPVYKRKLDLSQLGHEFNMLSMKELKTPSRVTIKRRPKP